jgi:hypothetical protein
MSLGGVRFYLGQFEIRYQLCDAGSLLDFASLRAVDSGRGCCGIRITESQDQPDVEAEEEVDESHPFAVGSGKGKADL